MLTRRRLAVIASGLVTFPIAIAAASAAPRTVMNLQLNDPAGSRIAKDSSGSGHNGQVGSRVALNGSYGRFPFVKPNTVSYGAAQLVLVPDAPDGSLDPGSGNFTIELRYRTTSNFGNILQKGQATTAGGQVKLEQPAGKLSCMFKTSSGTATATSGSVDMDNGAWHTVRCVRTPSSVTMYVNGSQTGRSTHTTGALNNTHPWSTGGKPSCDGTTVTCDYFAGDVDYVKLIKG